MASGVQNSAQNSETAADDKTVLTGPPPPFTGGQKLAHDPVRLDAVVVSGPNQYTVNPVALVSTVAPMIWVGRSVVPDEAALAAAGPVEVVLLGGRAARAAACGDRQRGSC